LAIKVIGVNRNSSLRAPNTLVCDAENCDDEITPNPRYKDVRLAAARDHGWSIVDGKDYCPRHRR